MHSVLHRQTLEHHLGATLGDALGHCWDRSPARVALGPLLGDELGTTVGKELDWLLRSADNTG
jgi:hypothetical protein